MESMLSTEFHTMAIVWNSWEHRLNAISFRIGKKGENDEAAGLRGHLPEDRSRHAGFLPIPGGLPQFSPHASTPEERI